MEIDVMNFLIWPDNQPWNFKSPCVPFWVYTDKLESSWAKAGEAFYYKPGTNNDLSDFFSNKNGNKFHCGRASLSGGILSFSGGRHRTRWYIDTTGRELCPIALSVGSIQEGWNSGLIAKEILEGEYVDLPITQKEIESEQNEYDRKVER